MVSESSFLAREADGTITKPKGITGLCQPKFVRPPFHIAKHAALTYVPKQVAQAYNYPMQYTGKGCKVGIIELGGGWTATDASYFASQGWDVTAVPVAGGSNSPGSDADVEVLLDIDVVGGVAPKATIRVYFAPNSDTGFVAAIKQARLDGCDVISVSWGQAEDGWPSQSITAMEAEFAACVAAGIVVTVAAGDNGSSDGETGDHVDYPGSSQYVLCCGGTSLTAPGGVWAGEVVWNSGGQSGATGGGVSALFSLPSYQANAGVPGGSKRGVPDIAGDADPNTGYVIQQNGQQLVVGGTSAVAPLIAGLLALIHEATGSRPTDIHTTLYNNPTASRDIVTGNNGTYIAHPGWDACTGMGVPDGAKLLTLLSGTNPPPPPPGSPTATLTASASIIQAGQSVTLTWTSTNGVSATLNGVSTSLAGTVSRIPTQTTTYTLVVNGAAGTTPATATTAVTVTPVTPPPPTPTGPTQQQIIAAIDAAFKAMIAQVPRNVKPWFLAANPYVDAHVKLLWTTAPHDEAPLNIEEMDFASVPAFAGVPWGAIWAFIQMLIVKYGPAARPYVDQYIASLNLPPFVKAMLTVLADALLTKAGA